MRQAKRGKRRRNSDVITWHKVLTDDEGNQLFDYLKGQWTGSLSPETPREVQAFQNILICELLFCTGIRVTELCSLRLCDTPYGLGVDVIEVYRGRNDKDRTISVGGQLAEMIKTYIEN